jgi:dipeptidyl aminopeptidase/acylaminoacyl peptidase
VVWTGFALAAPAQAAFPGQNGKIAFDTNRHGFPHNSEIYSMNADGSAQTRLTNDPDFLDPAIPDGRPAWSPDGAKIAFQSVRDPDPRWEIYTMSSDGSAQTAITTTQAEEPAWSPDGTKIAFSTSRHNNVEIYVMNADGSAQTRLTVTGSVVNHSPAWSPAGTKIAFVTNRDFNSEIYTMNPDGSALTRLTFDPPGNDRADEHPDWSPDGAQIVFEREVGNEVAIYTMNADGSGQTRLTTTNKEFNVEPNWSPDGTKIAFVARNPSDDFDRNRIYTVNLDGSALTLLTDPGNPRDDFNPDWQSIPINSYPRPKGATPFLTYLVPAYAECTTPNREHGPALSFGSCNPPTQTSTALTVGSADSNGKPTKSVSSVRFDTLVGNPSTPADEADVKITAQVIDVYTQAGLADYAGELTATTPLRITDKLNIPHPGGPGAGTVSDIPYGFTIPCAETADPAIGGACLLSTSADALAPGSVKEGKRSIWALGQVEVYDANDALFMKQGIFVP